MAETKLCHACGVEKPLREFYSSGRPKADGSPSYQTTCKDCCIAASHARWESGEANRTRRKTERLQQALQLAAVPTKTCRSCGQEKAVEDFYRKRVLKSGIVKYRPDCIACNIAVIEADPVEKERIRQKTADWRAADPDRGRLSCRTSRNKHIDERRATQRADRVDPVKRISILGYATASYKRHKSKRLAETKAHRIANQDHYRTYYKNYWKANPEKAAGYQALRRARKAGAEGNHTAADIRNIRERQGHRCANPMCNADIRKSCSIDHIVALVNGGSNWPCNLQALCKSCNSRKRSRDNDEFLRCYALEKEAECSRDYLLPRQSR